MNKKDIYISEGGSKNKGYKSRGTLFICATPIGNLEDASFRLIRILKEVDIIAAEDTRTIKKLLSRYEIYKDRNGIISYHDHSSESKIEYICKKLEEGNNVALVSESGMPAVQDPGYRIVCRCIEKGIPLTVIPGPNAAISALALSGLPADNFLFVGFLPKTLGKRKRKLSELSTFPYTLIFYESPNRVEKLLVEIREKMGDRNACLVRELTKLYEEIIRGNISSIISKIKDRKIKGEIVVLVEGYKHESIKNYTEEDLRRELLDLLAQNISKKNALKILLSKYDIDRQRLYNIATRI